MKIKQLLIAAIFCVPLLFQSVLSMAVSPHIRISQVYGGGGNAGAVYKNDFIELFNASSSPVSLAGWSVQYAAAASASWTVIPLSGTIDGGVHYLIQLAAGAGGTMALPAADLTDSSLNISASAGKVAIVTGTTPLNGLCPNDPAIQDLVGYGSGVTCFETSTAPSPSNTKSILRMGDGCTDTDNNAADFTLISPAPQNSFNSLPQLCVGVGIDKQEEVLSPCIWNSNNILYIDFQSVNGMTMTIELFDLPGRLLSREQWNAQQRFTKDLSAYPCSYIVVRVIYENGIQSTKLLSFFR